ncbi:glycosyltransferase, partial [SAR202 cluster bacterium AD-802-E10_MRT_200m]|nr:glycosyltransferase [SAR202 cluster bacterium AD-802-E10_MRT_200m]
STSIIIPAYNEAGVIEESLSRLIKVLDSYLESYEVIVVDDGSHDQTSELVENFASTNPKVRLVAYTPNRGKGFAIRQGFKSSKGSTVIFFDADLDIPSDCIPILLDLKKTNQVDVVVASKMHPDSQVQYPLLRKLFSRSVYFLVWMLLQIPVKDSQVGLKVFNRAALDAVMHLPRVDGFAFDIELLALIHKANFKIIEGPVKIEYRTFGSTVSALSVFVALVQTFGVFYRVRIKGQGSIHGAE